MTGSPRTGVRRGAHVRPMATRGRAVRATLRHQSMRHRGMHALFWLDAVAAAHQTPSPRTTTITMQCVHTPVLHAQPLPVRTAGLACSTGERCGRCRLLPWRVEMRWLRGGSAASRGGTPTGVQASPHPPPSFQTPNHMLQLECRCGAQHAGDRSQPQARVVPQGEPLPA